MPCCLCLKAYTTDYTQTALDGLEVKAQPDIFSQEVSGHSAHSGNIRNYICLY